MKLSSIHHAAIIVSDYEKSRNFYVNQLGFQVIREHYREERNDWKLDLQVGEGPDAVELEIFGEQNPPKRVNRPEACGLSGEETYGFYRLVQAENGRWRAVEKRLV